MELIIIIYSIVIIPWIIYQGFIIKNYKAKIQTLEKVIKINEIIKNDLKNKIKQNRNTILK